MINLHGLANQTIYVPAWYKKIEAERVPFRLVLDMKKSAISKYPIKLGANVEFQKSIYHYKGKISKIDGQKVTVKGTISMSQAINEALDGYYPI